MDRGKLIGEASGGSTGQPLMFDLPRRRLRPDMHQAGYLSRRKEFVGVGIQPDILVKPALADFRKNKETVPDCLEAGVLGAVTGLWIPGDFKFK